MKVSAFFLKVPTFLFLVTALFFSTFSLFSRSAKAEALVISDLSVSALASSATITWTTNLPATSNVEWGVTPDDEFTVSDSSLVTSHSMTITSLSANTLYYYAAFSADATADETAAIDSTFTTAASDPTPTSTTTTPTPTSTTTTTTPTSTTTTTTTTTAVEEPPDTAAPSLSLGTNLFHSYVQAPTLSGSATDDVGVDSVEYSTNAGTSWIPASIEGKSTKSASFSFSLGVLDDGNYNFQIRAKDAAGNTSEAKSYTLIIDRLPPQVGTVIFSIGPQVFAPSKEGVLVTVSGLEQKVTLSVVGGPTSLEVYTEGENLPAGRQEFNLTKNVESGLWSGIIKFDSSGVYDLATKSVDGAKNETIQTLAKVAVLEAGSVSYLGKVVGGAEISVYVFEPTLGQFILWDGVSYGQQNPQKTNENGNYSLFLPAGRYYIEAKVSSFTKLRTQIFELSATSPINADLSRESLSIPFIPGEIKIVPTKSLPADSVTVGDQVGKDFPFEQVKEATGIELAREKQIVSFVASWLPDTSEQIKILESLPDDVKVTMISPQESFPTIEIFKKRGRYSLNFLADPDGKLVEPLLLRFLPVHFFLDEGGKIKEVRYGVLSREEFLNHVAAIFS